jgi:hypothetical protein
MRKLLGWSLALTTAACGDDFVFRSRDFDRVAALQLCPENGDRFVGLELRVVPGPAQTPAGQLPGCVRLRFQMDGRPPPGLMLWLSGDLPLVEGERIIEPSCREGQPEAAQRVALERATGEGTLDGDELRLDAEIGFADGTTLSLDVPELEILHRDCERDL